MQNDSFWPIWSTQWGALDLTSESLGLRLGEGSADRWIYFALFDVAHIDRPANEATQAGVQRERTQTLEPIRGRDTAVACSNALWTRCADGALSLAARMWQAIP